MNNAVTALSGARSAFNFPFSRQIAFEAPNDQGGATPEQLAAAQAAAAATKAAADAAAADAAAKAAADAEASKTSKTIDDDAAKLLREVMEKKEKLKEVSTQNEQLAAELAKFKGINLDEVQTLLREKADREKNEAEKKGEFDRVKTMMIEEHTKEKEKFNEELTALKTLAASKDKVIEDLSIGNSFATSQFITSELTLTPNKARALYGAHFDISNGQLIAYDKPAGAASRTPLVDSTGTNLSFDEAMKRIIALDPERDTLIRAKITPGSSSKTQTPDPSKTAANSGELFGLSRIQASLTAGK